MNPNKGAINLIIGIIVAIALALGGGYYVYQKTGGDVSFDLPPILSPEADKTPEDGPLGSDSQGPSSGGTQNQDQQPVVCTVEAKICPDGSAVGRVGPNCEFAACPATDLPTGWQIYTNNQLGFQISYPGNLVKTDFELFMANLGHLANINFGPNLSINVWDTSTYTYSQLQQPSPAANQVVQKDITVDGHQAMEFKYVNIGDNMSGTTAVTRISIRKDNLVYILECSVLECDSILSTFKFTN